MEKWELWNFPNDGMCPSNYQATNNGIYLPYHPPPMYFSTVSLNPKWKILPTNIQIPFLGIILFGNFSSKSMFFGAAVLHVNPSEPKHVYV